ncbi:MAG: GTP-binding protein [Deltaproteobacteria bacterium]|jgi:sulfate adenylyltransferase large subunit|nr:GTP-binding protein [Deltaproteobacteria bacterium]
MGQVREKLKIVVTGHVDHGKSTVIGRLLFDTNSLTQGAIDRVKAINKEKGQHFEFAFLLDAFEEERKQGITIDTTRLQFATQKRDYLIIDAPGHKEFLKNMISGASDAEVAFLVVDAERGVEEQSKRHAHMLRLLGIEQIGVLVNKMDLVDYQESVFLQIKEELGVYLKELEIEAQLFVPLSGLLGENITKPSDKLSWFKGPTLIEALDSISKKEEGESLRLPIQDVYKFDMRRIIAGRLESGTISQGERILVSPGGKITTVASLESWLPRDKKESAYSPMSIGLTVTDEFFNQRGEVISTLDDAPMVTDTIKCSVFWMGKSPLLKNKKYKLKLATSAEEASVEEIYHLIDSESLAPVEGASEVKLNEVADVLIKLKKPIALDLFSRHKATGRFVLVDGYDVAGGGIVTQAETMALMKRGFVKGELTARSEVFEEYYLTFGTREVTKKMDIEPALYGEGDRVPLSGNSYEYPENFDIAIFRDRVAVRIREGRVSEIMPLMSYSYGGYPVVNGSGYAIKADSQNGFNEIREAWLDEGPKNEADLAVRYLDFNTFRKIAFSGADYMI